MLVKMETQAAGGANEEQVVILKIFHQVKLYQWSAVLNPQRF